VCYFVSVGAKAPGRLLAEVFDEEAALEVAISPVWAPVPSAFPADDQVCLVTWRGCSCDLIRPAEGASAVGLRSTKLTAAFQAGVVSLVSQLGGVRLLVQRHRPRCLLPAPTARLALTIHEFVSRESWLVEDVLLDISGGGSSSPVASS
jgi:hypothetical protein